MPKHCDSALNPTEPTLLLKTLKSEILENKKCMKETAKLRLG